MANKIEEHALEIGNKIAGETGMYVVDVTYKKADGKNVLCFYIDKDGGVGIDDCETFSRMAEPVLDESNIIEDSYSLEVSSPGADRRLKKEREFRYYIGRIVDVKLYKAADGIKEFSGVLAEYDGGTAVIEAENGRISVPVKDAAYIKLHFEF